MALRDTLLAFRAQKLKLDEMKKRVKKEGEILEEKMEEAIVEMEAAGLESLRIVDEDGVASTLYITSTFHPTIIDAEALTGWLLEHQPDLTMDHFKMISAQKVKGFCKDFDVSELPPGIDHYSKTKLGMRKA